MSLVLECVRPTSDPANPLGKTLPQIVIAELIRDHQRVRNRSRLSRRDASSIITFCRMFSVVRRHAHLPDGFELMDQRARPFNFRSDQLRGKLGRAVIYRFGEFSRRFRRGRRLGGPSVRQRQGLSFTVPPIVFFPGPVARLASSNAHPGRPLLSIRDTQCTCDLNPVYTDDNIFGYWSTARCSGKMKSGYNNWSPTLGLGALSGDRMVLGSRSATGNRFLHRVRDGYDSYFNNITSNMVAGVPNAVSDSTLLQATRFFRVGWKKISPRSCRVVPGLMVFLSQTSVYGDLVNPYYHVAWPACKESCRPEYSSTCPM